MHPTDALRTNCGLVVIYGILKYLLLFQSKNFLLLETKFGSNQYHHAREALVSDR